ncbi:reverse transcriptase domain-containing protein [Roseinatronobacter monicus]|uniref:reverse transcriptase domain-containing protein n=1 Tax=Roseinatronobacter monicus TaxID=393481 RepID=UPI001476AF43|nr:reverse transcriptase domain-containing protein [Roseinatronobacter monicus]
MPRLRPLSVARGAARRGALRFDAGDRPTLAALAARLTKILPRSPRCYHLKGTGGLKAAVRAATQALHQYGPAPFVYRTDVKSFYETVDAEILLGKVERHTRDRNCLNLLGQYLNMSVETGGNFVDAPRGLRAGGAPSPVLGAFYLYDLDCAMAAQKDVFYLRYMDDIIVISRHRWPLRRAIATIQHHFAAVGMVSHPDKTLIGRMGHGAMSGGVSFLGYQLSLSGLSLSAETLRRHIEKARRLYEQCKIRQRQAARVFADGNIIADSAPAWHKNRAYITLTPDMRNPTYLTDRLRAYETRFLIWAKGGLKDEVVYKERPVGVRSSAERMASPIVTEAQHFVGRLYGVGAEYRGGVR